MIKEYHGGLVLDVLEIVDFLDQVSVTVHEEPDALSHYLLCYISEVVLFYFS